MAPLAARWCLVLAAVFSLEHLNTITGFWSIDDIVVYLRNSLVGFPIQ